jgi:hypothetical protein
MDENEHQEDKKAALTFVRIPLVILVGLAILVVVYLVVRS